MTAPTWKVIRLRFHVEGDEVGGSTWKMIKMRLEVPRRR